MEKNSNCLSVIKIAVIVFFVVIAFPNFAIGIEQESDQQFLGFDLSGYGDNGEKTWEVKGQSADIFENTIKLKDVKAKVFEEETIDITSKTGNIDKTNNKIRLEEDVVITAEDGSKITTDSLDWMQNENIVTTEDNITIDKENITSTAMGARAQPNLNRAQMFEDVSVQIDTKGEDGKLEKTIITCDGPLEIDYDAQIAVFNNNVKVEDESGEILSDTMRVFFNFKAKEIDRIIANGNVQIIRGENTSYSDTAVYIAKDKRVVLTGRPKLVLYSEEGLEDVSLGD